MSAAETLRAMQVNYERRPTSYEPLAYEISSLLDVLPQLAEVIEAAERAHTKHVHAHRAYHRREDSAATAWRVVMAQAQDADDALLAALTALEDVLQ